MSKTEVIMNNNFKTTCDFLLDNKTKLEIVYYFIQNYRLHLTVNARGFCPVALVIRRTQKVYVRTRMFCAFCKNKNTTPPAHEKLE